MMTLPSSGLGTLALLLTTLAVAAAKSSFHSVKREHSFATSQRMGANLELMV